MATEVVLDIVVEVGKVEEMEERTAAMATTEPVATEAVVLDLM